MLTLLYNIANIVPSFARLQINSNSHYP